MGKSKISVIIAREFAIRVKKKSFILTTLLTPILFAALMVVPGLIAAYSEEDEARKIAVVDNSGVVMPYMQSDSQVEFCQIVGATVEELKEGFNNLDYFAVVGISAMDSSKNVSVVTYSKKQLNMDIKGRISRNVEEAVEQHKLQGYGIPQLEEIMEDIESDVKLSTYTLDESGEEKVSKVEIFMVIGYIASFLIYMFIFMFGSMVMRSVIEEKTTRIIEVIVSSVKPFQIMMGKIIGVASVALTQFLIWIVFTMLIVTVAGQALGLNEAAQTMSSVSSEVPVAEITSAMQDDGDSLLQALKDVNYVQIIGCFIIYFVLGYLLYSSMFAAVGAAVDNEADTQQLILPITMPLIVGLFLMLHTFQYPDSALSFWGSVIPFTSPMVMMARIAYGVPAWELALSIGVLVLTFVGMAYLSGRIYRVGILMYGKKPGWKEIWKWLKY
ncbi:MAG: ABC transporter permease [Bacteroidales bacterium]|nr:ABC transporter permease [Bacteroidales bacterium]